jgi:hypothetical protein
MGDGRKGAVIFGLLLAGSFSIPASAQNVPPVGNLQMPLVPPEQADQFFATRVVPPSSVPMTAPSGAAATQPPQSVNVDPILGHDLPTDPVGPGGLPRADFAIAKPASDKTKAAASTAVVGAHAPATTVIHQQPPTIGKP